MRLLYNKSCVLVFGAATLLCELLAVAHCLLLFQLYRLWQLIQTFCGCPYQDKMASPTAPTLLVRKFAIDTMNFCHPLSFRLLAYKMRIPKQFGCCSNRCNISIQKIER